MIDDNEQRLQLYGARYYFVAALIAALAFAALMFSTAASAQTATLTWTPPTTRADGSPVDLAGFHIYRGAAPDALLERTFVAGAATAEYVFAALPAGTSYFAVTAVDTSGNESAASPIVSKAVTVASCSGTVWRVAKNSSYLTRPAFAVLAGKRAATSTGRATVGAVCSCTAPIVEGSSTYCSADSAPLVAICVKSP